MKHALTPFTAHTVEETYVSSIMFAYWGLFLSFFLSGFLMPTDILTPPSMLFKAINYTTYLWLARLLYLLLQREHLFLIISIKTNFGQKLIAFIQFLAVLQAGNGLLWLRDAAHFRFLLLDFLPMFAIGFAYFPRHNSAFQDRFAKAILLQSFLAGLFSLYVLITAPIDSARSNLASPHFFALSTNFICLFALGNIHFYRFRYKLLAVISYISFLLLMIPYQSRGGIINILFIFPVAFLLTRIRMRRFSLVKNFLVIIALGGSLLFLAMKSPHIRSSFEIGWEGTINRLYGGQGTIDITQGLSDSFSSEITNIRGVEAREFISKATPYTWLLGHGWGGDWKSDFMAGGDYWQMVHFGPLHLILKGGIILSAVYIFLLIFAIFSAWKAIPWNPLAPGCFCFLLSYLADFTKHGPIYSVPHTYALWIILGISLNSLKTDSTKHPTRT